MNLVISTQRFSAATVTEKLLNMPVFKTSQNISVYISMHGEVCTQEIIKALLDQSMLWLTLSNCSTPHTLLSDDQKHR
jgi:5-formyltetrahydrofolate cyclo-ligase